MAMSSVSVVASSLMLNLYHPPKLPPAHTAQQSGLKDLRQVVIDSRRAASSAHGLQEPLLQVSLLPPLLAASPHNNTFGCRRARNEGNCE